MAANDIVLYHYTYSPYARRIVWYLALRGIPYSQCIQPAMLPRPDVTRLGISYRRIPILAIGRDVYLDTRLQLPKLEAMFPSLPRLGAGNGDQEAVERLLAHLMIDGGIFAHATQLLPTDLPLLRDPAYYRDRGDFMGAPGGRLSEEGMRRARPEALGEVAAAFGLLETTLLADGREWVLGTEGPSLADIEAVWPLHWLSGLPGALPRERFSRERYPRVYAWIARFQEAVSAAKRRGGEKPRTLTGEEAAALIEGSGWHEEGGGGGGEGEGEGVVDEEDAVVVAQGLRKGDVVTVWPTDTGRAHKDVGRLVSMNGEEVVIEVETESGTSVRVHAPRHGFRVEKKKKKNTEEGEEEQEAASAKL